jgi:hypothetical protein
MEPLYLSESELSESELSESELSENSPLNYLEPLNHLDPLHLLIRERNQFENFMYDYLITTIEVPESFWDPVIVCLTDKQIDLMKTINCKEIECFICKDDKNIFKKINCCDNKICLDCIKIWFNKSVFCPFCKKDQRTILDNLNNKEE